jgi:MFS family permease
LAARLLWGIAWSLINVGGYTMILDWSTTADRGRMTGFYQVAYMVGLSLSPILGGALTDALGFRAAVRIGAGVSAIGLAVAVAALPDIRPPAADPEMPNVQTDPRRWLVSLASLWRQMDRRILRAAYVYLVVFFVGNGVLMSTISLYLGQRWGTSISLGGVVIGVSSVAGVMLALRASLGILGGPVAGILSDRLGNRWPVIRVGIFVGVIGFVALATARGVWAVPVGVALVSLSAGALISVLAAVVGDLTTNNRSGITMGGMATAGDLGSATGPLVAYPLASALDLRWVYLFCAVLLVSSLLVSFSRWQPAAGQRGRDMV